MKNVRPNVLDMMKNTVQGRLWVKCEYCPDRYYHVKATVTMQINDEILPGIGVLADTYTIYGKKFEDDVFLENPISRDQYTQIEPPNWAEQQIKPAKLDRLLFPG